MIESDTLERPGIDAEIALAFGSAATSAFVGRLITEVGRAAAAAMAAAEQAKSDALSPTLTNAGIRNARELMSDAQFRFDRLNAACGKLKERLAELQASEENTRREIAYREAEKNRDVVASELAEIYPKCTEQLVALLSRLVDCNHQLDMINAKLPKNTPRLEAAEFVAKGITGNIPLGYVSVTESKLMPWTPTSPTRWPR